MENDPGQALNNISDKMQDVSNKIPFLGNILEGIDSRQLFSQGMTQVLRIISVFGSGVIGLFCVLAALKAFGDDTMGEGAQKFFAALTILAVAAVCLVGMTVIAQRSAQLLDKGIDSVLEIFLFLLRIAAELTALIAFAVVFCSGVNLLLLGDDAMMVTMIAMQSGAAVMADFTGGGGPDSSGMGTRFFGLACIFGSALVGYFVLFITYVIHDIADILYRFFNRGGAKE